MKPHVPAPRSQEYYTCKPCLLFTHDCGFILVQAARNGTYRLITWAKTRIPYNTECRCQACDAVIVVKNYLCFRQQYLQPQAEAAASSETAFDLDYMASRLKRVPSTANAARTSNLT
jgi:hypothetical protein